MYAVIEMTERFYQMAGVTIRVAAPAEWLYTAHGALEPFLTDHIEGCFHSICFEPMELLDKPQGECIFREPAKRVYLSGKEQISYIGSVEHSLDGAYLRIQYNEGNSVVQFKKECLPKGITAKVILNSMGVEHLVTQNRGFLLHASYIRWKDQAILFTAPSGTGKSTQADLWGRYRGAELINGDRAVVRIHQGRVLACGIPFSGSSGVGKNVTLPLAAIVRLSQAPSCDIQPLRGYQAFRQIWEGCSLNVWDQEDLTLGSQTVLDTIAEVPVYHLACTPAPEAVELLESVLMKGEA